MTGNASTNELTDEERKATIGQIEQELPRLRRFARYLAGNASDADDLVQECLIRALSNLDKWTPGTNLRAWLLVILKNVFRNQLRREKRERIALEQPDATDPVAIHPAQDTRLLMREVADAFEQLSAEHREVLLLVAVEGLKYEEAAIVLDVAIGTIKSRVARARTALKDLLDQETGRDQERMVEKGHG